VLLVCFKLKSYEVYHSITGSTGLFLWLVSKMLKLVDVIYTLNL